MIKPLDPMSGYPEESIISKINEIIVTLNDIIKEFDEMGIVIKEEGMLCDNENLNQIL
jgi:hypothetical protein